MTDDLDDLTEYVMLSLEAPEEARDAIRGLAAYFLKETYDEPQRPNTKDLLLQARWRDQMRRYEAAWADRNNSIVNLAELLLTIFRRLIPKAKGPVVGTVNVNPTADLVEDIIFDIARIEPLLPELRKKLNANATDKHGFTMPTKDKAYDPEKYLRDTPLLPLFDMQLPFSIPLETWKEHGFMAAPSGHGKSHTLKAFVKTFRDLPDPPTIFAIDSMGALFKTVTEKYDCMILSAESAQMNLFQLNAPPELYFYIFRAIDQQLTGRQGTMMLLLSRLLSRVPDATMMTMYDICRGAIPISDFAREIDGMEEMEQHFFREEFNGKDRFIQETKGQIKSRLQTLSTTTNLFKVFSAKENTFDPRALMDAGGKIVAVDTTGTSGIIFGRFIIAMIMKAARTRIDIPEDRRRFALLAVDEARDYFDETTTEILTQARQLGLGMFQATQFLADIPPKIKAALLGNTVIRIAGPVELADPLILAKAMRCEPGFIQNMTKIDYKHSEWACYVRNQTKTAVKLTVPMGVMEKMPNQNTRPSTVPPPHKTTPPQPQSVTPSSPNRTTPEKPKRRKRASDLDTEY